MSSIGRLKKLLSFGRIVDGASRRIRYYWQSSQDASKASFALPYRPRGLQPLIESTSGWASVVPNEVIEQYLAHRFDLLGSGWVTIAHAKTYPGLHGFKYRSDLSMPPDAEGEWLRSILNSANLSESQRIWRLLESEYLPIDWQVDFKSGFRWREKSWYRYVRQGSPSGADVKVPWELSRLQHLPQMAIAYGQSSEEQKNKLVSEFRNQLLDFIATNPPRWGVNWASTMEVGIRAANISLAYSLFKAAGACFDPPFLAILERSIYEHGRHIVGNLEWFNGSRANHYLANIIGLLYASAILPRSLETDRWLAFGAQQLIVEVDHQFLEDGGHFERSTAYHRLTTELVLYGSALVLGLSSDRKSMLRHMRGIHFGWLRTRRSKVREALLPLRGRGEETTHEGMFPEWFVERVRQMIEMTSDVGKLDGRLPQVGDNDSGRLFKLAPTYYRTTVSEARDKFRNLEDYRELSGTATYWHEDHLDATHLVHAGCGILEGSAAERLKLELLHSGSSSGIHPDYGCTVSLSRGRRWTFEMSTRERLSLQDGPFVGDDDLFQRLLSDVQCRPEGSVQRWRWEVPPGVDLLQGLTCRSYARFGLFVLRSAKLYVAIVARPETEAERIQTAHIHNDQLHVDLTINGTDIVRDPGSYLYTPLPDLRNQYRSVHSHFTPWPRSAEPAALSSGLFTMPDGPGVEVVYFGLRGFVGTMRWQGITVTRTISVEAGAVSVFDWYSGSGRDRVLLPSLPSLPFSPGYGIVEN